MSREPQKKIDAILVRLSPEQGTALRSEATASHEPMADIVRDGIDLALEKRKKERDRVR